MPVLDEADYLGDNVAILQAPGRLLALDNPVALKTQYGRGFSIAVEADEMARPPLVSLLQRELPGVTTRELRGKQIYMTGTNDMNTIKNLVSLIQSARPSCSYQVNSPTLEQIFIDLNAEPAGTDSETIAGDLLAVTPQVAPELSDEKDSERADDTSSSLILTAGRKPFWILAFFVDAYTIFLKRSTIARRSWLLPIIAIVIVVCASCIPLFFMIDRDQTCAIVLDEQTFQPITYPYSLYPLAFSPIVLAPAQLAQAFAAFPNATAFIKSEADNASFVDLFATDYHDQTFGGLSLGADAAVQSLFAWEGSALRNKGLSALNVLSNAVMAQIQPPTANPFRINLSFQYLASPSFLSTAVAFKWLAFM
jgi:ATP-binding cassette subfamily A (ABC1) protein 3